MQTINKWRTAASCLLGMAVITASASAHHSVARFDRSNPIAVTGTVKTFLFANPHSWIYLLVPNAKGSQDEWDLEGPSVNGLARSGWDKHTLKTGDVVRLKVSPRRDGNIGGEFTTIFTLNGKPMETTRP